MLEQEVELLIKQICRFMALLHKGEKLGEIKLEPGSSRLRVLAGLKNLDNPRMGELASVLGVTVPSLTGLVQKLEEEGLLERKPDPKDARAVRLYLSKTGATCLEEFYAQRREKWSNLLSRLKPQERSRLIALLEELYSLLAKAKELK